MASSSGQPIASPNLRGLTIKELIDRWMEHRRKELKVGKIQSHAYHSTQEVVERFEKCHGKGRLVDLLEILETYRTKQLFREDGEPMAPNTIDRHVQQIQTMLRWAETRSLLPHNYEMLSEIFCKTPQVDHRRYQLTKRKKLGLRLYTKAEIALLLKHANPQYKAMIYLALNCGFGNGDLGELNIEDLDLSAASHIHSRKKTCQERRAFLWPETVAAVKAVIATRPVARDVTDANRLFLTRTGIAFVRQASPAGEVGKRPSRVDYVSLYFNDLLTNAGVKKGRGFYGLRHTFRTTADNTTDMHAIALVMGHKLQGMAATYVQQIKDDRLRRRHRLREGPTPLRIRINPLTISACSFR